MQVADVMHTRPPPRRVRPSPRPCGRPSHRRRRTRSSSPSGCGRGRTPFPSAPRCPATGRTPRTRRPVSSRVIRSVSDRRSGPRSADRLAGSGCRGHARCSRASPMFQRRVARTARLAGRAGGPADTSGRTRPSVPPRSRIGPELSVAPATGRVGRATPPAFGTRVRSSPHVQRGRRGRIATPRVACSTPRAGRGSAADVRDSRPGAATGREWANPSREAECPGSRREETRCPNSRRRPAGS